MKTGTMVEYAKMRFQSHIANFTRLYEEIKRNQIDEDWLGWLESKNNIFPAIDYRIYQSRHITELPGQITEQEALLSG
jgi:1,4-alpha-glucan branching enzyme